MLNNDAFAEPDWLAGACPNLPRPDPVFLPVEPDARHFEREPVDMPVITSPGMGLAWVRSARRLASCRATPGRSASSGSGGAAPHRKTFPEEIGTFDENFSLWL